MTANARLTDKPTSQRAAESIPDDSDCIERVRRCVIGLREFRQPDIELQMRTLPIGLRANGKRWSDQRVRCCIADLEKLGVVRVIDDSGSHARYEWVRPKPVVVEPPVKTHQTSMFD